MSARSESRHLSPTERREVFERTIRYCESKKALLLGAIKEIDSLFEVIAPEIQTKGRRREHFEIARMQAKEVLSQELDDEILLQKQAEQENRVIA